MAYKSRVPSGRSACRTCQCMRCSCLLCEYEQYYRCYPTNAGCVRCMEVENDKPVKDCPNFQFRSVKKTYRIRVKRKDPYYKLARTLKSIFEQIQQI